MLLSFLYYIVQAIQPWLGPLCFVLAWALTVLGLWSLFSATRATIAQAQQMHRIPCADCRYYSGDYHLKCPVHPTIALSEQAINCPDFRQ